MKKLLLLTLLITFQISGQCELPVLTNFECSSPAVGEYPTSLTTIANPDKSGINLSDNVGNYNDDGTQGFDAIIFEYGSAIDLSTNNFLKIKFHAPKSVQILAKLEGGSDAHEIYSDFVADNDLNTWVEFTFDYSAFANNAVAGGDGNTRIVFFVNPGKTDGNNPDTYYIDDIMWSSSATAGLDREFGLNNVTVFPTIFDTDINIKSEEQIKELVVYDLNGNLFLEKQR